ncbi:DUF4417 domain-containing protein [Butyrivibrio proteoclasticus]|uniref:DUF4417 domain-containing protein n=1 Tax=Butyrivibrio proteoclasticus TaxID=43305 RepID=UPI00047B2B9F|nr:DUF4417 domain-containing protein [Butyrivibrio proteoclasticus]
MKKRRFEMDDGFRPEIVQGARFDGFLEIPVIEKPAHIVIPDSIVPFSHAKGEVTNNTALCFNDMDIVFADVIRHPEDHLDTIAKFPIVISPDPSMYRDQPLSTQLMNIYRNRAIGYFFQSKGIYVIPQIRWGDERTYTKSIFSEKAAFLGAPKHSIVMVSTYGCIQGPDNKMHFKNGLYSMLKELEPQVVLVYGPMPDSVFGEFLKDTRFIQYQDYVSRRCKDGKR